MNSCKINLLILNEFDKGFAFYKYVFEIKQKESQYKITYR